MSWISFIPPHLRRTILSASQSDEKSLILSGEPGSGKGTLFKYVHEHSPKSGKSLTLLHRQSSWDQQILSTNGGSLLFPEWETCDFQERETILKLIHHKILNSDGLTHIINSRVFLPTFRIDLKLETALRETPSKIIHISLPPLKERKNEIMDIASAILRELSHEQKKDHIVGFEREAEAAISAYDWPGNLRELRNVIAFALHRCEGDQISFKNLPTLEDEESFDFFSKREQFNQKQLNPKPTMTLLRREPSKKPNQGDEGAPVIS